MVTSFAARFEIEEQTNRETESLRKPRRLNLDPAEVPKARGRKPVLRKIVIDENSGVGPGGDRVPLVRRRPERQLTLS